MAPVPEAPSATASVDGARTGAALLLGWSGKLLTDVDVLGTRVDVVVQLNVQVDAARRAAGLWPEPDPWLLDCLLETDHSALRDSPLKVSGLLACRQSWRAGRSAALSVSAFGPRAVLVPERVANQALVSMDAGLAGLGLLGRRSSDEAQLVIPPMEWAAPPPTRVGRLVVELLYSKLFAQMNT